MNESTNKRLAEFVGVCWHDWEDVTRFFFEYVCKNCNMSKDDNLQDVDFSTPDGWQLIADEIAKRGEWANLYNWYYLKYNNAIVFVNDGVNDVVRVFHEYKPAEKSLIVVAWLKEVSYE